MIKHKLSILFLFLFVSFIPYAKAITELPLLGKVVYIDAGHGGKDPGAIYKDIKESDINLQISLLLEEELVKRGATVYQTRTGDYDLSTTNNNRKKNDLYKRVTLINHSDCNMYISIHLNSISNSTWYGAQVFYDDINKENEKIASIFQDVFKDQLGTNRKYKELKTIYLNKNVTKPGILIEAGFLSNTNERYLLKTSDYQKKLVVSIANATVKYLQSK